MNNSQLINLSYYYENVMSSESSELASLEASINSVISHSSNCCALREAYSYIEDSITLGDVQTPRNAIDNNIVLLSVYRNSN